MGYIFEEEFRRDRPETIGETDQHFDLDNYKDWLESKLIELRRRESLDPKRFLDEKFNNQGYECKIYDWGKASVNNYNLPGLLTEYVNYLNKTINE